MNAGHTTGNQQWYDIENGLRWPRAKYRLLTVAGQWYTPRWKDFKEVHCRPCTVLRRCIVGLGFLKKYRYCTIYLPNVSRLADIATEILFNLV